MDIRSDVCPLRALVVDYVFGLAAIPWLWYWGCLAAAEHGWANLEEGAQVMPTSYRLPEGLTLGHCAVCGDSFRYSKAVRPPKTCGMDRCMVKAGETEVRR